MVLDHLQVREMPRPLATFAPGTIGVSTAEILRYAAFWRGLSSLKAPPGSGMVQAAGMSIAKNRNSIVENMLATGAHWAFFLDDDLVLQPNTLHKLLRHLPENGGEHEIVCAFSLQRTPPFNALVYLDDPITTGCSMWVPDNSRGLLDIKAAGMGGVLVARSVFERLTAPYFRIGQVEMEHLHEDVEFFQRACRAGARCAVDLDTPIGHVTPMAIWPARDPSNHHVVVLGGHDGTAVTMDPQIIRESSPTIPGLVGM